jgi:hypothetical protein
MSVALPAVNGTTIRTGFVGYGCPQAQVVIKSAQAMPSQRVVFMRPPA